MSHYHAHLKELLADLRLAVPIPDIQISSITSDSRNVVPGSLFIALKGQRFDARKFIADALENGAVAVLYDCNDQPEMSQHINKNNILAVGHLSAELSAIAGRFYGLPSKEIKIIGITGTNGKTTIAYYLAQVLDQLGYRSGFIGTLGAGDINSIKSTGMTTTDAISTQKHLAKMTEKGIQIVCMEVSSHGLAQDRVLSVAFDYVVFSNLSQDHLDFHQTMTEYAAAKKRLFEDYGKTTAIINVDDAFGNSLAQTLTTQHNQHIVRYGISSGDIRASDITLAAQGLKFSVTHAGQDTTLSSNLIGQFNVYNLLAVLGTGLAMGHPLATLTTILPKCQPAPGRMERVSHQAGQPIVVVDYAHTPDALDKAIHACSDHCQGLLSVVFGCGGDRDKAKRAEMGRIAELGADRVFITDDNPRSELPTTIVRNIVSRMKKPAWVIHNRKQAIMTAIIQSKPDDWVLIAGKGHETRQVYANHDIECDDRVLARQALVRLAA